WGIMQLYGWIYEFTDGRGIHRQYELANLYQIGLVEQLSDLNISIPVIRETMAQNFCFGIRMSELDKRPLANVSAQMDKLLVIEKIFTWIDTSWMDDESMGFKTINWHPFLVEKGEVTLREHAGITIVIKLATIKEFVDSLIMQV
ncbi:MAG: hypothetical protein WBV23_02040, partial [Desulfobaccales bacterium]